MRPEFLPDKNTHAQGAGSYQIQGGFFGKQGGSIHQGEHRNSIQDTSGYIQRFTPGFGPFSLQVLQCDQYREYSHGYDKYKEASPSDVLSEDAAHEGPHGKTNIDR